MANYKEIEKNIKENLKQQGIESLKSAVNDDIRNPADQFTHNDDRYKPLIRKIYNAVSDNPTDEGFESYFKSNMGRNLVKCLADAPTDLIKTLSGIQTINGADYLIDNQKYIDLLPSDEGSPMFTPFSLIDYDNDPITMDAIAYMFDTINFSLNILQSMIPNLLKTATKEEIDAFKAVLTNLTSKCKNIESVMRVEQDFKRNFEALKPLF